MLLGQLSIVNDQYVLENGNRAFRTMSDPADSLFWLEERDLQGKWVRITRKVNASNRSEVAELLITMVGFMKKDLTSLKT